MDQNGELIGIRQVFTSMFMRGMRSRVPYRLIFALFELIYFVLPMLFVLIVVPFRALAIITPAQFVFLMIGEAIFSAFIYLRIVYIDHIAMDDCLRDIYRDHPSMRYDLMRSAGLQWADMNE